MKKNLSVFCGVVLLLMSVVLPGCSNSSGSKSSNSGSISSDSSPKISITSLPVCVIGQAYSQQISVAGGSGTKTFSITQGALPSGITLSSIGGIAGTTRMSPGVFQFTVRVQDAEGSDTQDFSLTVVAEAVAVATPQPYETIKKNPSYYYVAQESALCGATSFYMAMKYYGDHLKKIKTGIVDKDCPAEVTEKIYYPTELSATSQIATYIQYIDNTLNSLAGIHLSSLVKAAEGLLDESGVRALYSEVIVDN